MTKTQEITEKLQSGLSVTQLIEQGYKRGLIYKVKREISKGIKREISSKDSKVSGEIDLNENVDIEYDSDIMALKKELRKAELERQLAEIKIPIDLESRIKSFEEKISELNKYNDLLFEEYIDIRSILERTPLVGLRSEFECKCGTKGYPGLNVLCTVCGEETSYEWLAPG